MLFADWAAMYQISFNVDKFKKLYLGKENTS